MTMFTMSTNLSTSIYVLVNIKKNSEDMADATKKNPDNTSSINSD
jgi:hypothetical protein